MLAGAADVLGPFRGPALAVTRPDTVRPGEPGIAARVLSGDHPVPGTRSLAAGAEVLAFCDDVPAGGELLVLLSGGTSALVESLPPGIAADDLARANAWLLASGLDIAQVNAVRQSLSGIKAGRLAARLPGRRVRVLAVSDVPGNDPAVIGSGPFTPREPVPLPPGLPDWLAALTRAAPPAPRPASQALAQVDYRIVADGAAAAAAAADAARAEGLEARVHEPGLSGPVAAAAARILDTLHAAEPGVHVWHGETTVELPPAPGEGGRNRHLALEIARGLAGREQVLALCTATDGADGSAKAAGGWADGGTLERGCRAGLDPARALASADSGSFLGAAGDAWSTGPTGTNVMDLVIAFKGGGLCGAGAGG